MIMKSDGGQLKRSKLNILFYCVLLLAVTWIAPLNVYGLGPIITGKEVTGCWSGVTATAIIDSPEGIPIDISSIQASLDCLPVEVSIEGSGASVEVTFTAENLEPGTHYGTLSASDIEGNTAQGCWELFVQSRTNWSYTEDIELFHIHAWGETWNEKAGEWVFFDSEYDIPGGTFDPWGVQVNAINGVLSGEGECINEETGEPGLIPLEGTFNGDQVEFTLIQTCTSHPGETYEIQQDWTIQCEGTISDSRIEGTTNGNYRVYFPGIRPDNTRNVTQEWTWNGTFIVDIECIVQAIECTTVEIVGPSTAVLHWPVRSSRTVDLRAEATPLGGDYEWQILDGQDKVSLVGNTHGKAIKVKGRAPSEEEGDIVIKVAYTVNSQTCEDIHQMTVQKPTLLKVVDGYPTPPDIEYDDDGRVLCYTVLYEFQVHDQLDPPKPILAKGLLVWESRECVFSNYPYWPQLFYPVITRTNNNGKFTDVLKLCKFLWVPELPKDLLMKVNQSVKVAGWDIGIRCQTYYYDYATSEEGPCL